MVGRLVAWVAEKKDSIWVHWVHHNHLKGKDWMAYTPSTNSSWWVIQPAGYTPAGCYKWLRDNRPTIPWHKVIWNVWVVPKHQFLGWLVAQAALNTIDKLVQYGMQVDDKCLLCGQSEESLSHLFFECQYSRRVLMAIQQLRGCQFPKANSIDRCATRGGSKIQQGVQAALTLGAIYNVWYQRNKCRVDRVVMRPEHVADEIVQAVKIRIRGREKLNLNVTDIAWLN
ncbi:uncharacterized protein LOC141629507 [Silene latifolia]|uniref:uncharacterized protein LOC141629507 n=1 Tax=Silene latifolia TaxID=37657 RepID=UPI003D7772BF